jgi:hypothetical protein
MRPDLSISNGFRTSAGWCDVFKARAQAPEEIPWQHGARLSAAERRAVSASVQAFQLGESSEGHNLVRAARIFAQKTDDPHYLEAIRLFIGEEQRHARQLGRFLLLEGIPLRRQTWTDSVFRHLRRGGNLERSLGVLLVAEVIALVYYDALRDATGSPILRGLCERILRDEAVHVRFQCERLAILRRQLPKWQLKIRNSLHRLLFGGTCLVVWWGHSRVFRAAGYTQARFWRQAWHQMALALAQMDPQTYGLIRFRRAIALGQIVGTSP